MHIKPYHVPYTCFKHIHVVHIAAVKLQQIHTPFCEGFGVLFIEAQTTRIASTRHGTHVSIDSELQSLGMDLIKKQASVNVIL